MKGNLYQCTNSEEIVKFLVQVWYIRVEKTSDKLVACVCRKHKGDRRSFFNRFVCTIKKVLDQLNSFISLRSFGEKTQNIQMGLNFILIFFKPLRLGYVFFAFSVHITKGDNEKGW